MSVYVDDVKKSVLFFVGLHQPSDGRHFERACFSWRRLHRRRKLVGCGSAIIDSGAFMELKVHGAYRHGVDEYAAEVYRLHADRIVNIAVVVAQDYMCEPIMLAKTGLSVDQHQRLTIERYDELAAEFDRLFAGKCPFPLMPVLQGFAPEDYIRHIQMYGSRLKTGMWVGVGSVCKRNGDPAAILAVLFAIVSVRPDLLLHGFGVKKTSLKHPGVRELLFSADSMAWSDAARREGRNANDWREAEAFRTEVDAAIGLPSTPWQMPLLLGAA